MADLNLFFCLRRTPHIAAELKVLPPDSPDRHMIEAQIKTLSRSSLVAADKLLAIMMNWRNAPR
jgi:hypothetical protein